MINGRIGLMIMQKVNAPHTEGLSTR